MNFAFRSRASIRRSQVDETLSQEDNDALTMLEQEYVAVKFEASVLRKELGSELFQRHIDDSDDILAKLDYMSQGKVASAVADHRPISVREAARGILTTPNKAKELIVDDFEAIVRWTLSQGAEADSAKIRTRLRRRKTMLEAALPESMKRDCDVAFRQVERDHLEKRYVNDETMLGDKVSDIPNANFFASEDNYAFDITELVSAIQANSGVMRNPLSHQMFSEADIRTILAHPMGKQLQAMGEAQHQLKKGVREGTITKIEALSRSMLADQSMDGAPSRAAIEEFLGYVLSLPQAEQTTIRELKIPAVDKNTLQPFDYSIGESVNDAKDGMTCFHKVGDFLSQASAYLRCQ